jgi:hypothetical protein
MYISTLQPATTCGLSEAGSWIDSKATVVLLRWTQDFLNFVAKISFKVKTQQDEEEVGLSYKKKATTDCLTDSLSTCSATASRNRRKRKRPNLKKKKKKKKI